MANSSRLELAEFVTQEYMADSWLFFLSVHAVDEVLSEVEDDANNPYVTFFWGKTIHT